MREIDLQELKRLQIGILDTVVAFCEKHGIDYWLDNGTLLGAVRHKGYIPWDDDIDMGMLRKDYDKFMALFNTENERYKAYCVETDKNFLYPHGKVLDTDTVLYEPDEKGHKLSVNIDIFVYDNAPDDDRLLKKQYDKRDRSLYMRSLQLMNWVPKGNALRRAFVYFAAFIARRFPKNHFVKKVAKNSRKYIDKETKRVGNFTSFSRIACDKSIFDSFVKVEFEGKQYNAPVGYDAWLRAFYKDYMQLPPEEKRVSHHQFKAYVEE